MSGLQERIRNAGEQGFAMPWVILLLLLALTLGAATSRGSLLDVQTTQHFVNGNQAFAAAEGGFAYSLNAIAEMTDRLRAAPGRRGLVTGLGWYVTKHSVGVYGTERPASPDAFGQGTDPAADEALQRELDAQPHPALAAEPAGEATVETSTVAFDRDGAPMRGIVIGRLADGRRFLANTPPERDVLEAMTVHETVGVRGRVQPGSPNVFVPA